MTNSPIRVLLVDDEQLIRNGLAILLGTFEDIEIVGQAEDGQAAADFCRDNPVDIILMDIRMPNVNGIEGTKLVKALQPTVRILILTTFQDTEYISQAIRFGASGYLLKDSSHEEIYEGIKIALSDNIVLDGKLSDVMMRIANDPAEESFDASEYDLSEKEITIIRHIASGLNNQEIAEAMFLSKGTVKNNISIILNKLHLRDRTQLAIFAFEEGLTK